MNKNEKLNCYEKTLKIVEKFSDIYWCKYAKSIIEFNPHENAFTMGQIKACTEIREEIISQLLKECK